MSRRKKRLGPKLVFIAVLVVVILVLMPHRGEKRPAPPPGVRLVEIDLTKGYRIEPVMASDKAYGDLFAEMVTRLKPYAAINGTFYDENLRPLGDVVIGGKLVNRGHYRTAIGVRNDGTIEFRHRASGRFNWSGFKARSRRRT